MSHLSMNDHQNHNQQEYIYAGTLFGTEYQLAILHTHKSTADRLADEAITEMTNYEHSFSRFLPDSELSNLNRTKSLVVSPSFLAVIVEAQKLFHRTKGLFNPLVQISELGYQQGRSAAGTIIPDTTLPTRPYDSNFEAVTIDPLTHHIHMGQTHKIDLGGMLKGYMANKIARHIHTAEGVSGCIVNIGGDLAAFGYDLDITPFTCCIYNPVTGTETASFPLVQQCLATSGTYTRHWQWQGQTTHHIIDPLTHHNPQSTLISASIIHEDGGAAEAFTKVFLIAGMQAGLEILQDETYSYYLIANDGTIMTNFTTL